MPGLQHHFASMEARPSSELQSRIGSATRLIRSAKYLTAFTGAGISVESGIPPFRGPGGLWSRYDPRMLELDYFRAHPDRAWPVIREIFYDNFGTAKPNKAHEVLAAWERDGWPRGPGSSERGRLQCLITQNIDNLHHIAGSERLFWQNLRIGVGRRVSPHTFRHYADRRTMPSSA